MMDPILVYVSAAALSGIMLIGAVEKLLHYADFEAAAAGHALLPQALLRPFATAFVSAELAGGAMLLVPATRTAGAGLTLALVLLATLAVIINLMRGRSGIDCGCGGFSRREGGLSWWLVARNATLLALALPALLAARMAPRALGWMDVLTFFGATLAALGLYFCMNQLIASHKRLEEA
ncbi:MauE/DoxX family redox-associated membrane protein [Allopusillimonas soli]|nr:MauE/DoxX family redox-associated membrane protein [Allopusillimonas soli]